MSLLSGELEKKNHILDQFDLPSGLTSVASGRDMFNDELKVAYSQAASHSSSDFNSMVPALTKVDVTEPVQVSSVETKSGIRASFRGLSDHLETIWPDEHPARTPFSIVSVTSTADFKAEACILERSDLPSGHYVSSEWQGMCWMTSWKALTGRLPLTIRGAATHGLCGNEGRFTVRTETVQCSSVGDTFSSMAGFSRTSIISNGLAR